MKQAWQEVLDLILEGVRRLADQVQRLFERNDGRLQEVQETVQLLERGLTAQNRVLAVQQEMLGKVLGILSKEEPGPSRLVVALEALVSTNHEILAGVNWIEQDLAARPQH